MIKNHGKNSSLWVILLAIAAALTTFLGFMQDNDPGLTRRAAESNREPFMILSPILIVSVIYMTLKWIKNR